MKTLVNTFYNLELRLIENEITVLSLEAPSAYQKIMHDLWQQYNGNEGSFILSENGKELKIQKNVECIYNPFTVNLNDKKILTKLYQELSLQGDVLLQEDDSCRSTRRYCLRALLIHKGTKPLYLH